MTPQFFKNQIERLSFHFGGQHFKTEKVKLIWSEVSDIPDKNFKTIADNFIGNWNIDYPPKVDDFRVAAGVQRKAIFAAQAKSAAVALDVIPQDLDPKGSMQRFLEKMNADSLMEAILKTGGSRG